MVEKNLAAWWVKEVQKEYKNWQDFREQANRVFEKYRDERDDIDVGVRFNILYANTETLKPAIYSKSPTPDIRRRFLQKDPVGRVAADVLQKAVSYCIDSYDFDSVLDAANEDYLLAGFSVARVVYKPYFSSDGKSIIYQEAQTKYVPWDRFAMSAGRKYEDIWWVAFAEELTKDEFEDQFPDFKGEVQYQKQENDDLQNPTETTRIWEVWNKRDKTRFYISENSDSWVRKPEDDPLRLEGFFPNCKPLWSITTGKNLIPKPEYLMYQDQAIELDEITQRIYVLTSALRRRGVFDAANKDVLQNLVSAGDNTFQPVENWQALMEKGGLDKIIAEFPIESIANIVLNLYQHRENCKATIYEITGVSDIVRGVSQASETLGAQELKSKYATLRISYRQAKFAKFVRDLIRKKAELIAERFSVETLKAMTGVEIPTQQEKIQAQMALQGADEMTAISIQKLLKQPTWEEVIQLLRNERLRGFRIDIETDSTIQQDAEMEKTQRTEFLNAVSVFLTQIGPAVESGTVPMEVAKEMLMFGVRGFKVGSQLEQVLDEIGPSDSSPEEEKAQRMIQQAQQQMQEQAQEIEKRLKLAEKAEAAAKDAESQSRIAEKQGQLASANAGRAEDKVKYEQETFKMMVKFQAELDRMEEKFGQQQKDTEIQVQKILQAAEGAASEAIDGIMVPEKEEKKEEPKREPAQPVQIHINDGKMAPERPKSRKLKFKDNPDGTMDVEEAE